MRIYTVCFTLFFLISACGGSDDLKVDVNEKNSEQGVLKPALDGKVVVPDNREAESYQILMIGNSHTGLVNKALAALLLQGTGKEVAVSVLFGTHLDKTVSKTEYIDTLEGTQWSHVILQGQKYSQSQSVLYPTQSAKLWIQRAKAQTATPILFPEHPQQGDRSEARYVHEIHINIANEEPSCVAPVGLAWDLALAAEPNLALYAPDGNHASLLGALLSALVFYEVITGYSADLLLFNEYLAGNEVEQGLLRQMASQAIAENIACFY